MKKILAFIEIIRPVNVIITCLVILLSIGVFSQDIIFNNNVLFAVLAAGFVASSGNIINDYFDQGIDSINRPERPLPSKRITGFEAVFLYIALNVFAVILVMKISFSTLLIVLLTIILLFVYSAKLKSLPFAGNFVVAVCTGLAFVFAGEFSKNIQASIIPAAYAFQINLIREILKDVEDVEGDKQFGMSTIPIKYGVNFAKNILLFLSLILITSTFIPFLAHLYKIEYLIIVLFFVDLPLIYFIKMLFQIDFDNKISRLSNIIKLTMVFGLIAIVVGYM